MEVDYKHYKRSWSCILFKFKSTLNPVESISQFNAIQWFQDANIPARLSSLKELYPRVDKSM